MATNKQRRAAKQNIKKARSKWRSMSRRQHSISQPEGRSRESPGAGGGRFFRINLRPKSQFKTFRTQDVGERGHLERIAGRRGSGSWDTVTWLVSKNDAHKSGRTLIFDNKKIKMSLVRNKQIRGPIIHVKGDVFKARPRKNVPEAQKPTTAQKKARNKNIKKAQAARRS